MSAQTEMPRKSSTAAAFARRAIVAVLFLAGSALLAWLIATTTLPYALATRSTETALWLNPNNPAALSAHALRLRQQLLDATEVSPPAGDDSSGQTVGRFSAPVTSLSREQRQLEREALRTQIRDIAQRIIRNDPLNAQAYRLLAEVSNDPEQVRQLMHAALQRSRREAVAAFWLLNEAVSNKDYAKASGYADTILRTNPQLTLYVMSLFVKMMQDPEGRAIIERELAKPAAWRGSFFSYLPRLPVGASDILQLMTRLKTTDHPVTVNEQAPFLNALIRNQNVLLAYSTWLQLLPTDALSHVTLINNSGFEKEPSGLPFDWQQSRATNAVAEFTDSPGSGTGRSYHVKFGTGRITAPILSQTLVLQAGKYTVGGQYFGDISGKRGMKWQVSCLYGKRQLLAETDMIYGAGPQWTAFELPLEVPAGPDCAAQTIRLLHDARSASEQFVSGAIWFDNVTIKAATAVN